VGTTTGVDTAITYDTAIVTPTDTDDTDTSNDTGAPIDTDEPVDTNEPIDTDEPIDTNEPVDTEGPVTKTPANPGAKPGKRIGGFTYSGGSCGCASGQMPHSWWAIGLGMLIARRRRRLARTGSS